jgi:cytochrome c biogenesis protein CcmG/thiol:disulfide interchange protein DsbE
MQARLAGNEPRRWIRRALVGAAVVAAIAVAWSSRGDFTPADSGRLAPAYSGVTLDGETFDIEALRGSVVVLNIWATWCRPCVKEMPALQRLWVRNRDDGLVVVGVSVDNPAILMGDVGSAVRTFVRDHELTFPIVLDSESRIEAGYPYAGLPMTFVIDREGRIVERVIGPRAWDEAPMESRLRSLLES